MAKVLGAAIFGVGRIGQTHLHNLSQMSGVQVRWLVDVKENHSKMSELLQKYRMADITQMRSPTEIDEVLADEKVSFIVVCVPTSQHVEVIKKALKAGKHIFCEKPLAVSSSDVICCYSEAERMGRHLFCAYNRRFDPQLRQVYNDIQAGKFGKLRTIRMTSRDMGQSMEYLKHNIGGIFLDMGAHDIDYICWLVGERPLSVVGFGSVTCDLAEDYKKLGEYDTASAMLQFPGGATAQFEVSRGAGYGYDQRCEVLGTKRMAVSKNMMASELQVTEPSGINIGVMGDSFLTRYEASYRIEMEHFVRVLEGEEEMLVKPIECITATQVSEALSKSMVTRSVETLTT